MRTLAIGDIHGCSIALKVLLEFVGIGADDQVITLGDYVDRGPDTKGVIQSLMDLKKKGNLIALKGNHEQLMENACETRMDRLMWTNVGGLSTMISYDVTTPSDLPLPHWEFIHNCKLYHETESHIFVHGGLRPNVSIAEQDPEDLLWLRIEELEPHQSGKIIVCGHTPQHDFKPIDLGHAICIDTHAFANGWLTCFEVESGKCWQANESGKTREISL